MASACAVTGDNVVLILPWNQTTARTTAGVVYQHRCGTGDHIVRVDVLDREVVHRVPTGERPDAGDRDDALGGLELVARFEGGRIGPGVPGTVPEGMMLGRVQDCAIAIAVSDGDVGEFGVLIEMNGGDLHGRCVAGGGVGGLNLVTDLHLVDRLAVSVGQEDLGVAVETVATG